MVDQHSSQKDVTSNQGYQWRRIVNLVPELLQLDAECLLDLKVGEPRNHQLAGICRDVVNDMRHRRNAADITYGQFNLLCTRQIKASGSGPRVDQGNSVYAGGRLYRRH